MLPISPPTGKPGLGPGAKPYREKHRLAVDEQDPDLVQIAHGRSGLRPSIKPVRNFQDPTVRSESARTHGYCSLYNSIQLVRTEASTFWLYQFGCTSAQESSLPPQVLTEFALAAAF